jgi:NADH-quinone oxidoreductase subunit E
MCCEDSKKEVKLEEEDFKKVDKILDNYTDYSGNLITILQKIQEAINYIPKEMIEYLSKKTKINEAKIFGVVTFYSQFRMEPIGKHLIMLCQGTACHVNGSEKIGEAIKDYLKIDVGETTKDDMFTYTNVACLGCCSLAPVMMIDGKTYGNLTTKKAKEILEKIQSQK